MAGAVSLDISTDVASVKPGGGRVMVAINAKAGTARTADRNDLAGRIARAIGGLGEVSEIKFVEPRKWRQTLQDLASRDDVDTVIVGGGDGSISSAGAIFMGTGKTMGVIPLGTFNLFARSLRIPIGMDAALAALPSCEVVAVDVGDMQDGRGRDFIFLHHVSLGFHPHFIEVRDAIPYASRLGKMIASVRVWQRTLRSLKRLSLVVHGDTERPRTRYYQVAVTVGSFREGFANFPHAEDLTKGDLDLVLLPARGMLDFLMAVFSAAFGRWRSNSRLEVDAVRRLVLESTRPDLKVSVDGELKHCAPPFTFHVRPKALKVLMPPKQTAPASTALSIESGTVLR
jgi:diacylglycerol kinase family enzyme